MDDLSGNYGPKPVEHVVPLLHEKITHLEQRQAELLATLAKKDVEIAALQEANTKQKEIIAVLTARLMQKEDKKISADINASSSSQDVASPICPGSDMEENGLLKLKNSASLASLPDELLFIVFGHLDVASKIRLRRVQRKWNFILRDSSTWQTIKITEEEVRCWEPLDNLPRRYTSHPRCPPLDLLENLWNAQVFKHVKHLVLEGDYDVSDESPHSGDLPYPEMQLFPKMMDIIQQSKATQSCDFEKLDWIVVRKAIVRLDCFTELTGANALKCRLTVERGSVVEEYEDYYDSMEFEIPDSRTFELSGRTAWLDTDGPVVSLSEKQFDDEGDEYDMIPLELAEFVMERCNSVPAEAVALGDVYSELLKGREGIMIREALNVLFNKEFTDYDLPYDKYRAKANRRHYLSGKKHWQLCQQYHFNRLTNWRKYGFVFYTRPRNCFIPHQPGSYRSVQL